MNNGNQMLHGVAFAQEFARGYLENVVGVLERMDVGRIAAFVHALFEARDRGARIYFIGNGGSAATASHFANDIAIGSRTWANPFRAMSLTDNLAILTAIGNDYGYEEVFVRQLQTQMVKGDLVVAISASGNSANVVRAVEYANEKGAVTVALTGFDGGRLMKIAKIGIHIPTDQGDYGPVEDAHMVIDHLVGTYLQKICRSDIGGLR